LSFAALLVGSSSECWAQKTLVWKLPKGRQIEVMVEQDTDMKLEGSPTLAVKETHASQLTTVTWKVLDVSADGIASVEQAIARIVLDMQSQAGNFVIDTADTKPLQGLAETIARGIRPLAGARYVVKTKPNGEVVDVTIPEDVSKKMNEGTAGLGEAGLREIAVNGSLQFPAKSIGVGETWTTKYEMDMRVFGKLVVVTNYQYLGEEVVGGVKLDKIKATTATKAADPDDKSGLKLAKQESTGTIWFDNTKGCIDHSEFQQEMAMDVMQAGAQIKQVVTQKLKLTFQSR
jgi:hypothetical protein